MENFPSPRLAATLLTGVGAVQVRLDSGLGYVRLLEDLFAGLTPDLSELVDLYYEPLAAELVLEALQDWEASLSDRLTAAAPLGGSPIAAYLEVFSSTDELLWSVEE